MRCAIDTLIVNKTIEQVTGLELPNPSLDQTVFKTVQFANTVALPINCLEEVAGFEPALPDLQSSR